MERRQSRRTRGWRSGRLTSRPRCRRAARRRHPRYPVNPSPGHECDECVAGAKRSDNRTDNVRTCLGGWNCQRPVLGARKAMSTPPGPQSSTVDMKRPRQVGVPSQWRWSVPCSRGSPGRRMNDAAMHFDQHTPPRVTPFRRPAAGDPVPAVIIVRTPALRVPACGPDLRRIPAWHPARTTCPGSSPVNAYAASGVMPRARLPGTCSSVAGGRCERPRSA